jgi:hypothetical protein
VAGSHLLIKPAHGDLELVRLRPAKVIGAG